MKINKYFMLNPIKPKIFTQKKVKEVNKRKKKTEIVIKKQTEPLFEESKNIPGIENIFFLIYSCIIRRNERWFNPTDQT